MRVQGLPLVGLAWILALVGMASRAAMPDDVPGLVDIRLQRLGIEEGLSQSTARVLAQDGEGMIWIGTQDGLNRYDGEDFRVFRRDPQDPTSLSDNHIIALSVDSNGALWVGTQSGGLGRYDADTLSFKNYPVALDRSDAVAAVPVNAISQAADGKIWVASGRGHLQRLDPSANRFDALAIPSDLLVRSLLPLPQGDVLIGSTQGLWRWRAVDGALAPWAEESARELDVQALARDAQGRIWAGTAGHGAFQFDPDGTLRRQLDRSSGLAGRDVRSLLVDRDARVWIGSWTGLSRVDAPGAPPRTWSRDETRRDGLVSERVHALLQDRDGLVWIGTWLGGVNVYLPGTDTFREYRSVVGDPRTLPGRAVRSVLADKDGTLWLGVQEGGGLVHFDPAQGVLQRFRPQSEDPTSLGSDRVQSLASDLDGNLWIGFVDAGLDRRRPGVEGFEHFRTRKDDPNALLGDNVNGLYVDRAGTLWVGFQDAGMDSLCRGCTQFQHYRYVPGDRNGLPGQAIGGFFETTRGEFWVGARPGGLARLDRASGRFTPLDDLLESPGQVRPRAITAMIESRAGELWVGTQGDGVVRLTSLPDGKLKSTAYTHREGLAAEAIGGILEDERGAMWVSTTLGISRIEPESGRIENFSGRAGAQLEGYFINASTRLADGTIVFGGIKGLTVFRPNQVLARGVLHQPAITDVRVFQARGKDRGWRYRHGKGDAPDSLWLKAGSGGFGITYSALAFVDPDQVQYSYRLDPIDRDWIESGASQRHAGYPHLTPGDYELRLRTRFAGEDYSPERRIAVRLDPLWWQSDWARGGVAALAFVFLGVWAYNRRQRSRERRRAEMALAESEQRLKLALWGTGDEFWDADMRDGHLVRINPLDYLEVNRSAESSLRGFTPFVHPDDVAAFGAALHAHTHGKSDSLDVAYRTRDTDGRWRWLRTRGRAVERDENGRVRRMAGITQDITELREYERTLETVNQELEERVDARTSDLSLVNRELVKTIDELKLTQHQLVESEKLAALGGLVAGIAHEVNTPLGVGVTAASHLEQQAKLFAQRFDAGDLAPQDVIAFRALALDCSTIVLRNLQRADKMIRSFKQVAVDQASEQPRRINLADYVEEILISLQPTLKRSKHRVEVDVPADLVVLTHPGALYQIISNMLMNSLTHAFEGRESGRISLRARREPHALVIEFADDGCGMNEEVRRRLFDPFFTTRRGQGGSGLGMHIVYNLTTQVLGGTIECDTAPGQGARFVLRVPLSEAGSSSSAG